MSRTRQAEFCRWMIREMEEGQGIELSRGLPFEDSYSPAVRPSMEEGWALEAPGSHPPPVFKAGCAPLRGTLR